MKNIQLSIFLSLLMIISTQVFANNGHAFCEIIVNMKDYEMFKKNFIHKKKSSFFNSEKLLRDQRLIGCSMMKGEYIYENTPSNINFDHLRLIKNERMGLNLLIQNECNYVILLKGSFERSLGIDKKEFNKKDFYKFEC